MAEEDFDSCVLDSELLDIELDGDVLEGDQQQYCTCERPSTDHMIACDGPQCPHEWYHYDCVGLTEATIPKGKWYCSICTDNSGMYHFNYSFCIILSIHLYTCVSFTVKYILIS